MPCTAPPDPVGLVLAGGCSSRMGTDKAELEWRPGQSLLARAIELAEAAGCARVIVSGDRPGHDCVPDRRPGRGPLAGLEAVLDARAAELNSGLLLVLPLDMPLLQPATLRELLVATRAGATGAVFANGPLPMAVRIEAGVAGTVSTLLDGDGKHSLRELARALELKVLAAVPGVEMDNINRPGELDRLRRNGGVHATP